MQKLDTKTHGICIAAAIVGACLGVTLILAWLGPTQEEVHAAAQREIEREKERLRSLPPPTKLLGSVLQARADGGMLIGEGEYGRTVWVEMTARQASLFRDGEMFDARVYPQGLHDYSSPTGTRRVQGYRLLTRIEAEVADETEERQAAEKREADRLAAQYAADQAEELRKHKELEEGAERAAAQARAAAKKAKQDAIIAKFWAEQAATNKPPGQ